MNRQPGPDRGRARPPLGTFLPSGRRARSAVMDTGRARRVTVRSRGVPNRSGAPGGRRRRGRIPRGRPYERAMLRGGSGGGAEGPPRRPRLDAASRAGLSSPVFCRSPSRSEASQSHEAHVPSPKSTPQEDARVPRPHEDQRRAQGDRRPPQARPQAPHRFLGQEVARQRACSPSAGPRRAPAWRPSPPRVASWLQAMPKSP